MSQFIMRYPNQFDEIETHAYARFAEECAAVNNRGPIDVHALVSETLPPDTPGLGPVIHLDDELVEYFNSRFNPYDPLYNDVLYARNAGFENIPAIMTIAAHDDTYMVPAPETGSDIMLISGLNHSITNHRPIYAGDTLYLVINHRNFVDVTPAEGSIYRTIAMTFDGEIFNQRGELVNSVVFRVRENLKTYKPDCRPAKVERREAPDWGNRPDHIYTDDDWKKIMDIWSKETIRGATPLYFEDVNIGDEPAWTLDGPIDDNVVPLMDWGCGVGGSRTLKTEILNPVQRAQMKRNPYDGIYRLDKRSDSYPKIPAHIKFLNKRYEPQNPYDRASWAKNDDPMCEPPKRAMLNNHLGRDYAIRHFTNWMGDKGWLKNISWGIMNDDTMRFYGFDVPPQPDAVDFLEMFPDVHGKCLHHPMERDVLIVRSRVYDKKAINGENRVELAWWIESILGEILEEGRATVVLPSKNT